MVLSANTREVSIMQTNYHVSVVVETAIEMLKKGKNIFDCPIGASFTLLWRQKKAGKKYYTGCEKENDEGKCAGHPDTQRFQE